MKQLVKPILLLFLAFSIGAGTAPHHETRDRLPPEKMERLVERPMKVVRSGGRAAGEQEFAQLLAAARKKYGRNSVRAADLITSFGIELYTEGLSNDDDDLREAALNYFKAAIPADRAALGAMHPEVAVALQTYVDAELEIHKDKPAADVAGALQVAYDIRLKALGPTNLETLAVLKRQAIVEGHPWLVKQDPAHLRRSEELFEQLIEKAPGDPTARDMSAPRVRISFARMYARNGMGDKAVAEALQAVSEMKSWPTETRCVETNIQLMQVAQDLRDHGQSAAAEKLPANNTLLALLSCAMQPDDQQGQPTTQV